MTPTVFDKHGAALFCREISLGLAPDLLCFDFLGNGYVVDDVGSIYCVYEGGPVIRVG
jgi:hypothetical protein